LLKEKEKLRHGATETLGGATNGHSTYQENSLELFKVIDALSEQLVFHLVGDHI
jgi:hypothetical protein